MPPYHNMAAVVQDIIFAFPFLAPRMKNTRNTYFLLSKNKTFLLVYFQLYLTGQNWITPSYRKIRKVSTWPLLVSAVVDEQGERVQGDWGLASSSVCHTVECQKKTGKLSPLWRGSHSSTRSKNKYINDWNTQEGLKYAFPMEMNIKIF